MANMINGLIGGFGTDTSLLFFFLLLVIIFSNCETYNEDGDSLLFFFLLLIVLLCNCNNDEC